MVFSAPRKAHKHKLFGENLSLSLGQNEVPSIFYTAQAQFSEKLEKVGTVDFKKHPARKVGTRSQQCGPKVPGRFAFPVPEILVFAAFGDSGKIFQQFSRNFPGTFLQNSRKDPRNSHGLLEFSEVCAWDKPGVEGGSKKCFGGAVGLCSFTGALAHCLLVGTIPQEQDEKNLGCISADWPGFSGAATVAGTQSTNLFGFPPLFYKAPPRQFQPPKCKLAPSKM